MDPGSARPPAPAGRDDQPTDVDVENDEEDLGPIPWHLKLLAGAVALYLGWRAFQGIEWVVHRF